MRRCLDCPRFIQSGSRCVECARAKDRTRQRYRSGYSRTTWAKLVKERDGQRCRQPGCQTPYDRVEAHHIIPLAEGGADTITNGVTLCHAHHQQRHGGR